MGTPLITTSNIVVEACNILYGERKVFTIQCVADSSGSLGGTSMTFVANTATFVESTKTIALVTGTTAPPALVDNTVTVTVPTDSAASAVAILIDAGVELFTTVLRTSTVLTDTVTVTLEYFGSTSTASAGDTGFTVAETTVGTGGSLGGTDGGVTINFEKTLVEVKPDQTGDQLQDDILTGVSATIDGTLLELNADKMSLLIGTTWGGEITPGGGTKVVGIGDDKNFSNMKQYSKELILKPVADGDTDFTNSHFFWKAFPDLTSIGLSGTEKKNAPVTFKAYRDATKDSTVNVYAYGDGMQDLDA